MCLLVYGTHSVVLHDTTVPARSKIPAINYKLGAVEKQELNELANGRANDQN